MQQRSPKNTIPKGRTLPDLILKILEGVGNLGVALNAPNIVQVFDFAGRSRQFPRKQFRTALKRLEKRGYIHCQGDRTSWDFRLTKEGREILRHKRMDDISIRPQKWDGKWRLVIFDIPEKFRSSRDALRGKLNGLGFQYLNLSVWVHPFECRNEINAIIEYYGVGEYVRCAIVESFDGTEEMKKRFAHLLRS